MTTRLASKQAARALAKKNRSSRLVATGMAVLGLSLCAPALSQVASASTVDTTTHNISSWKAHTKNDILAQLTAQNVIPTSQNAKYTVQWGDTLWAISQATDISVEKLAADNGITNIDLIETGSILTLNASTKARAFVAQASGQSAESKASTTPVINNPITNNTNNNGSTTTPTNPTTPGDTGNNSGGGTTDHTTPVDPTDPTNPTDPVAEYADVTVKAVDANGNVLKTATVAHQEVGKTVSVKADKVAVDGYDLADSATKSVTVAKEGNTVTFTYAKQGTAPVDPVVEYADVTVNAVDESGNVLKTTTVAHQKVGDSITVEASSVSVDSYDLKDTASKLVTVNKGGTSVNFVYGKHEVTPPVGNIYTPNAEHIKALLMSKIDMAGNGKFWGAGDPADVFDDQHMHAQGYYESDEEVANAMMQTFDDQSLTAPELDSAVMNLTASGSTDKSNLSGSIEVNVTITWYWA